MPIAVVPVRSVVPFYFSVCSVFLFMSFSVSFWFLSASVCVCPALFVLCLLDDPFCVCFCSVCSVHVVLLILLVDVLICLCLRSSVSFCFVFRFSRPSLRDPHVPRPSSVFPSMGGSCTHMSGCEEKSLGGHSTRTMTSTEPPAEGRVGLRLSARSWYFGHGRQGAETGLGAWRRIVGCHAV